MKHIGWLRIAGILIALTLTAQADSTDFTYTTNNSAVTITGYIGPGGGVVIPDQIEGLPVTEIGLFAFYGSGDLTGITIPYGVTNIGEGAFWACPNLTAINVNATNTFFSSSDGVLIDTVHTKVIQCPEGKTGVVTIPDGITVIGEYAFSECIHITAVSLPGSVTNIQIGVFWYCPSLTAINVDAVNAFYSSSDGVLIDTVNTAVIQCPEGKAGSVTISDGITVIGEWAFSDCISVTNVIIPASVTVVDDYAFSGCTGLTALYFEGNAPELGIDAFEGVAATVYYLAGTTGWQATYGGLTTQILNPPQIQIINPGLAGTNGFGFTAIASNDVTVVVEACTNLVHPSWDPLQTNSISGGVLPFSDPQATNFTRRYYRVRVQM